MSAANECQPTPVQLEAAVFGCLDHLNRCSVRGWLVDTARDEPLAVSVWLDGQELRRGQAGALRSDVAEVYGTSGRHGFALTFHRVPAERLPELEIRYAKADGGEGVLPVTEAAIRAREPEREAVYSEFAGGMAEGPSAGGQRPEALRSAWQQVVGGVAALVAGGEPSAPGPCSRLGGGGGVDDAGCLHFVHVPKTAGTSFRRAAEAY